jgi:hypothetical protein
LPSLPVGNDAAGLPRSRHALCRSARGTWPDVYDPGKHLRQGETLPAPDKTKQRLGRYIEDALPGIPNEELRGLANKTIEVAHQVKHRHTPTRREAGIAADAVILPGQHASAT